MNGHPGRVRPPGAHCGDYGGQLLNLALKLYLVTVRLKIPLARLRDHVVAITDVDLLEVAILNEFVNASTDRLLREWKVVLAAQIDVYRAFWQRYRVFIQESEHSQSPFFESAHWRENRGRCFYGHRISQISDFSVSLLGLLRQFGVYWEIFITSRSLVCANDCRANGLITRYPNGPCGPAVGSALT